MHPLLARQLEESRDAYGEPDLRSLLALVERRYHAIDHERVVSAGTMLRRFAEAIDQVHQGLMLVGPDGRVLAANRMTRALLGLSEADVAARPPFQAVMARLQAAGAFKVGTPEGIEAWAQREIWDQPPHFVRIRGDGRHIEVRTTRLADGSCIRTYADVTDAHRREQQLIAAEREYRALFENAVFGIYRSSVDGKQLRSNPALSRLNGYETEAEHLSGVNDIAKEWYVDPNRRNAFVKEMLAKGRVTDFVSEIFTHKTRRRIWISETAWTVRDEAGRPLYFEGMVVDATQRVQAERRIGELLRNDPLTGLANRRAFTEALKLALRAGRRRRRDVAVCCIDLDRFKQVNDTQGHFAGDALLKQVARRLKGFQKDGRLVARIGGDEFAIIAPDATVDSVMALGAEVIGALSRPYAVQRQRTVIGGSMGVAIAGAGKTDSSDLLKMADIALYAAKAAGKGRAALFRETMREPVQRRQRLEQALRQALANGEMHLEYQPVADLRSGMPRCHEALMRWRSPELGIICPSEFIPIAEETGLIHGLGHWLVREACADAARRLPMRHVAINVSAVQLRSPHFRTHVVQALAAAGLAPYELELEITENVLLTQDSAALGVLKDLRAMGVRVALDDFGTGWSSLSSLRAFPFDKIKIDRSFVAGAAENPVNAAVVKAVIGLAADLGMELVAEGVETEAQAESLKAAGCHLQQGYLHGRPFALPPGEAAPLPTPAARRVIRRPARTGAPLPPPAAARLKR